MSKKNIKERNNTDRTMRTLTAKANDIMSCTDLAYVKKLVGRGISEREIRYLMKLGMDVPLIGARIAPIFCAAMERAGELKLSDELQEDIEQFIELCRLRDGFVIVGATDEDIVLHFADDVIPE